MTRGKSKPPTRPSTGYPTEAEEARALMAMVRDLEPVKPELALLYHTPNEGKRNVIAGANLRRAGMKAGVPDYCLPVPRKPWCGLYIELKRAEGAGGGLTVEQRWWLEALAAAGNYACVCRGAGAAIETLLAYLDGQLGTGDGGAE